MISGRKRVDKWRGGKCRISLKWKRPRRVRPRDVVSRVSDGSSEKTRHFHFASGVKTAGLDFSFVQRTLSAAKQKWAGRGNRRRRD